MDLKKYLIERNKGNYDRDNYDAFLKKVSFKFNIPAIHIAGTNGKGSTANYLANIYQAQGLKVAIYDSPYYQSPCEMIRINQERISDETFEKYLNNNKKLFEKYSLSEFEIETYIALSYFNDNKCDIAIIECGMGGEIDATNVFTPLLSIITSVSMEHTAYLGKTLSEIALHKAGIIKDEVPVLIHNKLAEDVLNVLRVVVKENRTKISTVDDYHFEVVKEDGYHFTYGSLEDLVIPTLAKYSIHDACFAIEAVNMLKDQISFSNEAIYEGLKKTKLNARMTLAKNNPTVYIDGAHNLEAIERIYNDILSIYGGKKIHIVFATFKDKNLPAMLSKLGLMSDDITLTTFDNPRARDEMDYFLYLEDYRYVENYKEAIQSVINQYPDDFILITGSLAFALLVDDDFKKGEIK